MVRKRLVAHRWKGEPTLLSHNWVKYFLKGIAVFCTCIFTRHCWRLRRYCLHSYIPYWNSENIDQVLGTTKWRICRLAIYFIYVKEQSRLVMLPALSQNGPTKLHCKGQMKSEYIYEIINFPKYHQKYLINFCPESLFKLGMLCTHLSRVALRIIKTNHKYLVYKTFQGRNLPNFFDGILENQWFHKYILTVSDL